MKVNYFYELKHYSKERIKEIFGKKLFEEIREFLLINRYCIENIDTFQFEYVGVILIKDRIVSVLPKYLTNNDFSNLNAKRDYTKLIIQVLKKYNKINNDVFNFYFNSDERHFLYHKFSLIDYLLKDYYEYGIYENTLEIIEENGFGEISWEDTIERETAYLNKKKPIYLNCWTHEVDSDTGNYITLLHQFILNKSVNYLKENEVNKLLEIMEIPYLYFPINEESIGDIDYQIKMIDEELKTQFNDRKINLLKSLKSFILEESFKSDVKFSIWGTGTFYTVWENVCSEVLKNEYKKGNKFFKAITDNTKATWNIDNKKYYSEAMRPDIILTKRNKVYLIDAKYYTKNSLLKMGIQDIAKQFMYLKALREKENTKEYTNCFIAPGLEDKYYGTVSLPLFRDDLVHTWFLDTKIVFENYLENKNEKYLSEFLKLIDKSF